MKSSTTSPKNIQHFASRINTRFYNYITLEMIALLTFTSFIVILMHDVLLSGFTTNIGLNGTIFATFFYALFLLLKNNYDIYKLSLYLHDIENVEMAVDLDKGDVDILRQNLTTKGRLIDMQSTYAVITKMKKNGFFFPTNEDARAIKSSLGTRIRIKRGYVGFLASILVTFGLIGTFWGLIITITSIGETMVGISKTFSTEGGQLDLGALISGISQPLGGMGVAFSSSLYGLAGSLIIGIMSTLANKAQSSFIERFSRWMDEHIPEINFELAEKISENDGLPVEINQEQDHLIKAFVVMAQETHQQLRSLGGHIKDMVEINKEQLSTHKDLSKQLHTMQETHNDLSNNIQAWHEEQKGSNEILLDISHNIKMTTKIVNNSQSDISQNVHLMSEELKNSSSNIEIKLLDLLSTQSNLLDVQKISNQTMTQSQVLLEKLVTESQQTQETQQNLTRSFYVVSKEISHSNKEFIQTQDKLYAQTEKLCESLTLSDKNQTKNSDNLLNISIQLNSINEKILANTQQEDNTKTEQQQEIGKQELTNETKKKDETPKEEIKKKSFMSRLKNHVIGKKNKEHE